jgi:hypothetical protein
VRIPSARGPLLVIDRVVARALLHGFCVMRKVAGGGDEGDMREGLRKVADQARV